jgi:hypothetical protein
MEGNATRGSLKVRLVVTSDNLIPKTISDFLGVSPTKTWQRGDPVVQKATKIHKENGWVLSLEFGTSELIVEPIIDRLIAQLPQGRLAALCRQYQGSISVELSIIAHVSADFLPSISISPAQVTFLAGCNGEVDVDLYHQ